jgi:NifU-like protein involved in Fe-S cluster formation
MAAPFSPTVMEHFLHPRHTGPLPQATGEGWGGSPHSSRYMRIQVAVLDGVVVGATFGTYGCAPAIAAGSYLCDWALGKPIGQVEHLTGEQLTLWLGGLPEARRFCAHLAVDALRAAVADSQSKPCTPEVCHDV